MGLNSEEKGADFIFLEKFSCFRLFAQNIVG